MSEQTLAIEGSTYAGSVALLRDDEIIAERTLADTGIPSRGGREERVLPSVAECLDEAGIAVGQLSRVVCGAGPGSFTSLRISASVAKGIAVGVGCPLYSVSSLLLSVASAPDSTDGFFLSVLPAMRNEWFALLAEVGRGIVAARGDAFIVTEATLAETARRHEARLLGPGQEVNALPHARGVVTLLDQIVAAGPVVIETWEPDYGRLAEAQVRWEAAHGRPLGAGA
ncbi:MAG TPA: tRNA (adenosine(37)-N6)-threonylcarbamoyltransferase complex dimerization subunit type 1 TsaB [Gemmatimonadaceae bacterium]